MWKMITLSNYRSFLRNYKQFRWLNTFNSKQCTRKDQDSDKRPTFLEENTEIPSVIVNKSKLLPQHRNMLQDNVPYNEPHSWIHLTEKYQRKMIGRYGIKAGMSPRVCFNTTEDAYLQKNYESIAYPNSLPQMISEVQSVQKIKCDQISKREEDIFKKLQKLEQWKRELNTKIAKKETGILAAKEKKERLIEEVRRHFGFKVDPREERFKEMLEQKEREDKKKQKEAKRKAKEEKMMAKLVEKTNQL